MHVPPTPEEAERAKIIAAYRWFRQRLVLLIVVAMLVMQFMTWRSIEAMRQDLPRNPPRCGTYDPCIVELDEYSLRQLRPK
jgi:hypothetical protein